MSKKLPILMLLMALFAPWAVNAQETLTVYDGTTTSSYVPAYMSYFDDFSRSQFVIPASNLEIMGDGTINSIKFYTTDYNVPYTSVSTVDVFLMEVNYTTMTALESKTNGTIVYQGTLNVISEGSGGSLTINFSTPYNYGGGNLLIGIENTTDAGYKFIYFYGQTVSGASFAGYNSSSLSNVTGSQQNFIPKTTFTYEVGSSSSCPRPSNLECTAYTSNTATLSWNETGTATNWVLEYGTTANFAGATSVNVSDTPSKSLTNLTPETKYYARVKAVCGDDNQSNWSNTCEFKPSDVQVVTIGSGETTNTYLPAYTFYNYNLSEQIYTAEEVGMAGTINSISFFNGGTEKSPEIKIYMVNTDQTEFSSNTNWLAVTANDLVYDGTVTFTVDEWTTIELDTPFEYDGTSNLGLIVDEHMQYSSGLACRVFTSTSNCAMYVYSDGTDYDAVGATYTASNRLSVKNQIKLEITPDSNYCPRPTNLTVNNITSTSAAISWNGSSDSYLVMVKESSQPESANYTYDFEDGWQGWTTFQGNTTSPNSWMHNTAYPTSNNDFSTGYGYNNSDGFMLSESYISGSSSGAGQAVTPDNYLVSPQVPLGGSISFYAGARNTEYCAEKFSVMVSTTDNTNPASFTTVGTWTLSLSSAGYTSSPYTVDLSAYSGMGYVAIRHFDCYDQWFLAVDDITIDIGGESPWTTYPASASPFTINDLNPGTTYDVKVIGICDGEESNASTTINFTTDIACPAPTDVTVSDITGHEATVTWTGSSESYIVKYRTAAYMDGFKEEFNTNVIPSYWTKCTGKVDQVIAGTTTLSTGSGAWTATSYGLGTYNAKLNIWGTSANSWLVSPEVTLVNGASLNFDLALTDYNNSDPIEDATAQADDRFIVLIYANNAWTILREWNNSGSLYIYNNIATAGENVNINLSAYQGQTVKIAFYGESTASGGDNDLHIDNVAIGLPVAAGEWQTVTTEEASVTLTGLDPETLYEVVIQGDCGDEGMSTESEPVTFTTDVSCPAPANLTVSDIYAHGATVSWDRVADANNPTVYFQFVCVEHGEIPDWTDAPVAIDRPTNPNPPTGFFSGLAPETEYDAYIRRICGTISPSGVIDGEFSAPVIITFTTTVACPAPTDVTVSDITGHGATVTWTGHSEGYYVTIGIDNAPVLQNVDFANGVPSTWNNDASHPWTVVDGHLQNGNSGISSSTSSISVTLTFPANGTVEFDAECRGEGASSYYDHCDFNIDDTRLLYAGANINGWNHYTFDVTAGQHTFTWSYTKDSSVDPTGDYFAIDNVVMKQQSNLVWEDPIFVENTEYTFSGLSSETTYFVTVQSDCGDEGMSSMSDTISFITDVTCPAPHDLTTSDVTSNSAMLHWIGDAASYNVSYYKAYFFDSFEEDLSQWTIIKDGDDGSFEWAIENPHDNSADLNAHSGSYAAVAYSNIDIHADSWLVTPQITMPTQATLKFWVMRSTYDDAQDEYEVRLSTTGNDVLDFTTVLKEKEAANSAWSEVSIDLSAYDGQQCYIAIRHDFTGGFFIMVDDFGIYGWSEDIVTTDNSLLIEDLLPETAYQWHVQANCGEEDGLSQWSNIGTFTTLKACPVPFDLTATEVTANGATIAWTGYNDSYSVWVGQLETASTNYDFEDNRISDDFINSTSYPWTVVQEGQGGGSCIKSGNSGVVSSTSAIEMTVDLVMDATLSFDFWSRGEGSNDSYDWDKSRFYIDGIRMFDYASHTSWESYSTTLTAGTHTLKWEYKKDGSTNPDGDCFYVDNITIESLAVSSEMNYTATESPLLLNDASYFLPETTYLVKIKGICDDEETEYSEAITFTTLDENTKIFVIEGDWSDGDNWVPAGVPSIEQDVILRAEATVFDVAEANVITIEDAGALTIEDGGQLKTNADVEASMKKFIIGYGTDYVETNNGYYLMTLPTAAPISAADAGLITEESEYDLYSWDRTATDEEWQNNHDGIDLQNGIGYLYANRDDMEMSFTSTLRNSSEPVVVTPSYDEVEHGGWNLCGNPFPCEAYITTDADSMTFYRLVDNNLELIEGAIAPLEAFFVKATAAGQTFTISREAPAK